MFWQEVPVHTLLKSPKIFYTFKSKIGNVFYKGQKILEANYGDLNSSKKQTKSEKEFDLRTLRPFKKNSSYFGRNEGVVNWFRDFLTNTKLLWFLDKCVRKIVAKIAQSAARGKTDEICTAKILFLWQPLLLNEILLIKVHSWWQWW